MQFLLPPREDVPPILSGNPGNITHDDYMAVLYELQRAADSRSGLHELAWELAQLRALVAADDTITP